VEHLVQLEMQVIQGQMEHQDKQDLRDKEGIKAVQESPGHQDSLDLQARGEVPEMLEIQVLQVLLVLLELQVTRDHQGMQDLLVTQEVLDSPDLQDSEVNQD